ncbi:MULTISPECIES: MFS transporter [Bacillus]|uniref:MFS transporter n=2 Tax=Bacillus thuringiensis TaxID=1428 RepID=A0AAP4Q842_BACTU|nr:MULTISPECIES: MFS transporter [Bacillus]MEC2877461.1 MFS transporter [Bacillus cereus]AGG02194.1 major facilitator family transporter [Bacillus thuringiensis serovar thuringiensis str. IS5056]EEM27880.1 Major facilitator family transporter [Bacillus thuringiensis Bt407]EEM34172.1 Major facilitator family transporter [Bacillus thuringiensis serovar thuringiensis str. T01001]EEM65129.1 Major facilitator family transporter [Bacillus thuringiensis serovar berliner ATCC 10792]
MEGDGGIIVLMEERINGTYKWVMLIFATVAQTTATLITYGVGAFALFWKEEYALTNTEGGLLVSVVNIGPLFCMLFVGRLLDQYNEKLLISISSFLLGGSFLLTNMVNGFNGLLFVLLLVGTFYSVSQPGGSKVIMKWFRKENRGLAIGIRQAGIPIGGTLAGVLIPFLTIKYNMAYAVNSIACICIIGGFLFFIFYKEPYIQEKVKQERIKLSFWMQLKEVMCKKELYAIYITGICMISLQMVLVGHFIKFLVTEQSITPILAGKVFSVMFFSGMVGRVILAATSDLFYKGNRRTPLFITVCISIFFILILVMSIHTITNVLYGVSALLGFFSIGWFSLFIAEVSESASEESVGMTVSFALTLNQIAIIVAPALFGYIVDKKGYTYAWLCIVVLLTISAVSLYRKYRK